MLTSLKIENFRGIQSLSIEDMGRINIFIGENGAGKTTVLESIWVIAQPTQPGHLNSLSAWREMPPPSAGNDLVFYSLFYNGDDTLAPTFHFIEKGRSKKLTISASDDVSGVPMPFIAGASADSDIGGYFIPAVKLVFIDHDNVSYVSRGVLGTGSVSQIVEKMYQGFGCFYIHARRSTSISEMASMLTTMSKNRTISKFWEAMKLLRPKTNSLEAGVVGQQSIVLVDTGLPNKLPINVLGDGYCRMALITTGLFFGNSRVVAIDEIDSGLHVSVMEDFWANLGNLSRTYDKQIFCTTHNEEILKSTIGAFSKHKSEIRIFRVDRSDDGETTIQKYTYDDYLGAIEAEADIR